MIGSNLVDVIRCMMSNQKAPARSLRRLLQGTAVAVMLASCLWCSTLLAHASDQYLAVKVVGPRPSEAMSQLTDSVAPRYGAQAVVSGSLFARYNIVLLKVDDPDAAWREITTKVAPILKDKAKLVRVPVIIDEGITRIPTGEVVVQFAENTPLASVHHVLDRLNLRIIKGPEEGETGRYVVTDKADNIERALEAARTLRRCSMVKYADPNTLQLMNR